MDELEWREQLKVGDEVAITCWRQQPRIATVEKVTSKYFDVRGVRYRKDNGHPAGGHGGSWMRSATVKQPTAEHHERIRRDKAVYAFNAFRVTTDCGIPTENIERAVAALKGGET